MQKNVLLHKHSPFAVTVSGGCCKNLRVYDNETHVWQFPFKGRMEATVDPNPVTQKVRVSARFTHPPPPPPNAQLLIPVTAALQLDRDDEGG